MKINLNKNKIFTIILMATTFNCFAQINLNPIEPSSRYEGYYESFKEENLFGKIKSLKKFENINENFHSNIEEIVMSDTLAITFWYELNPNQEIVFVSSPQSWRILFKDEKFIKSWRYKNDLFQLTQSYSYNNIGQVQKIVNNDYSYEQTTIYYYKDKVAYKSEETAQGYKTTHERINENDNVFSIVEHRIDPNNIKTYKELTKFIISEKKVTEIKFNAGKVSNPKLEDLTNEYFRKVTILNDNNQIIEESFTLTDKKPVTTVHKYKYDEIGNKIYHEQYELGENEKSVWTTEFNKLGQKIKSEGSNFENNNLQYTTLNVYKYDQYGNLKSENQTGTHVSFEYSYDSKNNWIVKKHFFDGKLLKIEYREIEYFD